MSATNGRIHVLLLEEDQKTASAIEQILAKNGYVVDVAGYDPAFVCVGAAYLAAIAFLLAAGRIEPLR